MSFHYINQYLYHHLGSQTIMNEIKQDVKTWSYENNTKKYSAKKARDFRNYKKKPAKYMIKYSLPLRYDLNT